MLPSEMAMMAHGWPRKRVAGEKSWPATEDELRSVLHMAWAVLSHGVMCQLRAVWLRVCVCVFVYLCVCVRARACVRVCVCVAGRARGG